MKHIENVVIGDLLVHPSVLFAFDMDDWKQTEKDMTVFTNERFLPKILVDCCIAPSISEVRRNIKDLVQTLDKVDFKIIKWGKHKLFIGVGR
jgi:hypothetical protein